MRMRRSFVFVFLISLGAWSAQAKPLPLTTSEVGLMLRGGYSNASVMRELSTRRFADTLDATKEGTLVKAGANADLIGALNSGAYAVAPQEAARAQEEMAVQAKRKAAEADARKFDTLHHDQEMRARVAAQSQAAESENMYKFLRSDLVRCRNGSVSPAETEALARKKLIAFYFSAHWCGPCRKFTPQLVEYYNRVAAQHPEFEIIFYSLDKSASAMETYMRETNMPWPAIDYQKLAEKEVLKKNAGNAIPCLVLVDGTGKIVSNTFNGGEYLGPQKVLADLDGIFAGAAPQVAVSR
jgi:nucleoredoxin